MNILQIIPNIGVGGAERFVVDLSNELVENHNVSLVTLYDESENELFRSFLSPKVKTITLGKRLGFDIKVIKRLYSVIEREKPNVIHTHLSAFNYIMPLIPLFYKIPIIHTVHNDAFKECVNAKIRIIRKLWFKKRNIYPVTISRESDISFKNAYGNIKKALILNGRKKPYLSDKFQEVLDEVNFLKKNDDTKVFVNIGRQETQKNQLMLTDAFCRMVNKDGVNAILLIIGGGRANKKSLKIQHDLKLMEKKHSFIHLLGERKNATDYLYASDYFCLSSLFEGMPITLIEAFATGVIPVCTPVGGVSEMVSELDHKLLSTDTNMDSYYELLKRVYKLSSDYQKRLKQQAEKLFEEKYSMKQCGRAYEDLYKKNIR